MRGSVAEVCRAATWKTQQPRISFTHTSYFLLAVKKRGVQITERLAIYVDGINFLAFLREQTWSAEIGNRGMPTRFAFIGSNQAKPNQLATGIASYPNSN